MPLPKTYGKSEFMFEMSKLAIAPLKIGCIFMLLYLQEPLVGTSCSSPFAFSDSIKGFLIGGIGEIKLRMVLVTLLCFLISTLDFVSASS